MVTGVLFCPTESSPPTPSFVNAVRCDEGGPFVDCIANPLNLKVRKNIQSKTNVKLSKSEVQARLGVCIVSLIETCKLNTVEPQAYLVATLTANVNGHKQGRIDDLLPWNYPAKV